MKLISILSFVFFVLFSSCNSTGNEGFEKEEMLKNIAENLAIPSYEQSLKSFQQLQELLLQVEKGPNTENLHELRNSWKSAALKWSKTAPYRFGPIDELLIENNFYYYPIDTVKVKQAISSFNNQKNSVERLGSNVQGLGAIEYILFQSEQPTKEELAYCGLLSDHLVKLNQQVLDQWINEYSKSFVSNTGSDIGSSLSKLTNQWIEVIDYIKGDEVGRPAGKTSGIEKNVYNLHAPYSQISLKIIHAKLSALQLSFNGDTKKGVDDYLDHLDIKLSDNIPLQDKINEQINTLLANSNQEEPLTQLILEGSKEVDQIYLQSLNLSIIFKTELMGQLGLVTTFSDSDGD
ncbi:hypothetical protein SAMN05661096_03106 [Marivirga sericea]|uniref:Imelysin-like domain-containing protein n=1 Tax=Marivirga sericea TaxID=1028 RepID=A0A1X7KSS8_9BACT|nr:imelysin family protein [Marivirga sericea]SMG44228.1 hypothetical protein SAMN05661096_03106 [Marivirga sericea]